MKSSNVDIDSAILEVAKYLVPQGPLKEFVAQNPLKGFMSLPYHEGLRQGSKFWGSWSYMPLEFFRQEFQAEKISKLAIERSLERNIPEEMIRNQMREDLFHYPSGASSKPRPFAKSGIRAQWDALVHLKLHDTTLPIMYRLLGTFLDQGIAVRHIPNTSLSFRDAVRKLVEESYIKYVPFHIKEARELLYGPIDECILRGLDRLVGDERLYARYIQDIVMSHPGWSAVVWNIQNNEDALLMKRAISLKEIVAVEIALDLGFLIKEFGSKFKSLKELNAKHPFQLWDENSKYSRISEIKKIWHEAWEWSLYEQTISLVESLKTCPVQRQKPRVQALFCIDDRECSIRRHLEEVDEGIQTWGLPGFFGVDFMYQCANDTYPTRHAPIVVNPKHLIVAKELGEKNLYAMPKKIGTLHAFSHTSHSLFRGWVTTQFLGFVSAIKMAAAIIKPTMTQATASSLSRVNENIVIKLKSEEGEPKHWSGYKLGFSTEEMADKLFLQLQAIGLMKDFAPLVFLIAHGSSSTNNTHFSAYDCGACSGKPGSPNARVFAKMANDPQVRDILKNKGVEIPDHCHFVAALHDTSQDEFLVFDRVDFPKQIQSSIDDFICKMKVALGKNSKERCRRFEKVDLKISVAESIKEVKRRSFAIFEPRPELTHAGNALAIVGRRHLTLGGFFDRRAFLHSYDPMIDPDGKILSRILAAVVPVCGGINLCYNFSKLDNDVYGAGSKLPHNVIGLLGVANGVEGDLLTGLPKQMVEYHEAVRLMLVIEQNHEIVASAFKQDPGIYLWLQNEWMRVACVDPEKSSWSIWEDGKFRSLNLSDFGQPPIQNSNANCYENSRDYMSFARFNF